MINNFEMYVHSCNTSVVNLLHKTYARVVWFMEGG